MNRRQYDGHFFFCVIYFSLNIPRPWWDLFIRYEHFFWCFSKTVFWEVVLSSQIEGKYLKKNWVAVRWGGGVAFGASFVCGSSESRMDTLPSSLTECSSLECIYLVYFPVRFFQFREIRRSTHIMCTCGHEKLFCFAAPRETKSFNLKPPSGEGLKGTKKATKIKK